MLPRVKHDTMAGVTEDPTAEAMMGRTFPSHAPEPGSPSAL